MRRIALIALAVATALAVAAAAFGATILNNPTHKFNLAYSKKALAATAGSVTLEVEEHLRCAEAQHRPPQRRRRRRASCS